MSASRGKADSNLTIVEGPLLAEAVGKRFKAKIRRNNRIKVDAKLY